MVMIPEKYFSLLEKYGEKKRYRSDEMVFMESDSAQEIYLIESGRVRVYLSSMDGKEITLSILKKGRIFGDASFVADSVRTVNIQAVVDTVIVRISTEKILPVLHESQELMTLMFQHLTETVNLLTHQIARLVYCSSEQKVADFLLSHAKENGNVIPFSQENLAGCLGMNRVTVTRILKKMREAGAIDKGYGVIRILNPDILREMVPEDSIVRKQ